jgi:hypothetical protein
MLTTINVQRGSAVSDKQALSARQVGILAGGRIADMVFTYIIIVECSNYCCPRGYSDDDFISVSLQ